MTAHTQDVELGVPDFLLEKVQLLQKLCGDFLVSALYVSLGCSLMMPFRRVCGDTLALSSLFCTSSTTQKTLRPEYTNITENLRPSHAFLLEKGGVDEKRGTHERRSHRPVRLIGPVDAVNVLLETTLIFEPCPEVGDGRFAAVVRLHGLWVANVKRHTEALALDAIEFTLHAASTETRIRANHVHEIVLRVEYFKLGNEQV